MTAPSETLAGNPAPAPAPLIPALVGMTGLQALVGLSLFAPGVLAPALGIEPATLGIYPTVVFSIGMVVALYAGALIMRLGAFGTACFVAVSAIASMGLAALAGNDVWVFALAAAFMGLACGPETPASSAILGRLATPRNRPLVFSVRQTGNQIGAMTGAVSFPILATIDPRLGYAAVMVVGAVAVAVFWRMRRRYDPLTRASGRAPLWGALGLVRRDPRLMRLALVCAPYSAMQIVLNTFFVSYAVRELGMDHLAAGATLAVAQGGGLVGRLGWGVVATRITPRLVVGGLGLAMGGLAAVVALAAGDLPAAALTAIMFLFGLTASGWNGVFLSEVARIAPPERVGEITGAVLVPGYAGLIAGPLLVGALSNLGGLSSGFLAIAVLSTLGGLLIARGKT